MERGKEMDRPPACLPTFENVPLPLTECHTQVDLTLVNRLALHCGLHTGADFRSRLRNSVQPDVNIGQLRETVRQDGHHNDTPAVQSDLPHVHQRTATTRRTGLTILQLTVTAQLNVAVAIS